MIFFESKFDYQNHIFRILGGSGGSRLSRILGGVLTKMRVLFSASNFCTTVFSVFAQGLLQVQMLPIFLARLFFRSSAQDLLQVKMLAFFFRAPWLSVSRARSSAGKNAAIFLARLFPPKKLRTKNTSKDGGFSPPVYQLLKFLFSPQKRQKKRRRRYMDRQCKIKIKYHTI